MSSAQHFEADYSQHPSWLFNLFSAICGALEAFCVQGCFLLWLSSHAYPSSANTTYPLGISAIGIISQFSAAIWIDTTGKRLHAAIVASTLQAIVSILLLVPNLSSAGTFFAFYLAGTSYIVNPLLFGWANVILKRTGDDGLRSATLYSMNAASSILYTFWGIALYPGELRNPWASAYRQDPMLLTGKRERLPCFVSASLL